jgi:DNA-binding NtrC family response regulator
LRERREDILPLAKSFAEQVYSLNPAVNFAPEALALLECYLWPGNIRELENAVVRAAAMCDGTIRVQDLPERVRNYRAETTAPNTAAEKSEQKAEASQQWSSLAEVEGRYVAQVLEHTRGNKQAAARLLGVDRKTVERIVRRQDPNSKLLREAS